MITQGVDQLCAEADSQIDATTGAQYRCQYHRTATITIAGIRSTGLMPCTARSRPGYRPALIGYASASSSDANRSRLSILWPLMNSLQ